MTTFGDDDGEVDATDGSDSPVRFDVVDPAGDEAQGAMMEYFAELDRRFPDGFDPELGDEAVPADELAGPGGAFLLARAGGDVVGCGGVWTMAPGIGEIKRMWVAESYRGRGLGKALLAELEDHARRRDLGLVRLDTNGELNTAIAMYGKAGYRSIEPYNDNPFAELWFEKEL